MAVEEYKKYKSSEAVLIMGSIEERVESGSVVDGSRLRDSHTDTQADIGETSFKSLFISAKRSTHRRPR